MDPSKSTLWNRPVRLKLNCYPPHEKQLQFINTTLGDGTNRDIRRTHLVCGRGWGKTTGAIMLVLEAMRRYPGISLLFLAPTHKTLERSFVAEWQRIVPNPLYKYLKSDKIIEFINGSKTYLSSCYIDNPSRGRDADRGVSVQGVVHDETAWGFNRDLYTNVSAAIRGSQFGRFYACLTTPVLNDYQDVATSDGHILMHGPSWDNPYLPDGWAEELSKEMSPQQYKREIDGQWVPLEGRIWDTWSDEPWPRGNRHHCEYNPHLPWYLFLDLGVGNAAYLVVQRVDASKSGLQLFPGSVWVVVAQLMPDHDGSASRAFQRLGDLYGRPCCIVGGADMNTRSVSAGDTAMYFARQVWGEDVMVKIADGWIADKQVQYNRTTYLIRDAVGARRFCVSKDIQSLDSHSTRKRGILDVMAQDTWPDNVKRRRVEFFPKEGVLEHCRDALLYGAVCEMAPPTFQRTSRRPG